MTDLLERKNPVALESRPPALKRGTDVPPPTGRPRRFLRWMGWMVGIVAVAAIVTWAILSGGGDSLADISPHDNPEVVLEIMPSADVAIGSVFVAPPIDAIDPHESPEVVRVDRVPSG